MIKHYIVEYAKLSSNLQNLDDREFDMLCKFGEWRNNDKRRKDTIFKEIDFIEELNNLSKDVE